MRTRGEVLYWYKCLDLMNKFIKDEVMMEMPVKVYQSEGLVHVLEN